MIFFELQENLMRNPSRTKNLSQKNSYKNSRMKFYNPFYEGVYFLRNLWRSFSNLMRKCVLDSYPIKIIRRKRSNNKNFLL